MLHAGSVPEDPTKMPISEETVIRPPITNEIVGAWMRKVDKLGIFGKPVDLSGPDIDGAGKALRETVIVRDAVEKLDRQTKLSSPIVIIGKADGTTAELPAADFLRRSGFDTAAFQETLEAEAASKRQKAAQELAEMNIAANAEREMRQAAEERRKAVLFATVANPKPGYITEDSRKLAAKRLDRAAVQDKVLAGVIDVHKKQLGLEGSLAVVDAMRNNSALRFSVGSHMLDKVNALAEKTPEKLPLRVVGNGGKMPPAEGLYPRISEMSSREYAALLALAKIDGSFNSAIHPADKIEYDQQGIATLGQHRAAAETILTEPGS